MGTAKGERTFYAVKNGTPRIEETNLFSLAIQRVPFLSGVEMTERKYLKHWKRKNKDKIRTYRHRYFKKNPWAKWKCLIASRCACHPLLLRLGIKNKITTQELKQLWFRDKAWLLKRPSIDRKDSQKSYTFANCRFIEFLENTSRPKIFALPKEHKKLERNKHMKMRSNEIEIAIARHFNSRMNLIVPNVFWGLGFGYELDLMIVTQSHYGWEVEIKVSLSDLKNEKKKKFYAHCSNKIRRLYFAVPDYLQEKAISLIPEKAGLLIVDKDLKVTAIKPPKINKSAQKLSQEDINKLYELAAMRIWSLKEKLIRNEANERGR